MTETQAHKQAHQMSLKSALTYYVVFEDNEYHVATLYDLETYFEGIRDDKILAAYKRGDLI